MTLAICVEEPSMLIFWIQTKCLPVPDTDSMVGVSDTLGDWANQSGPSTVWLLLINGTFSEEHHLM